MKPINFNSLYNANIKETEVRVVQSSGTKKFELSYRLVYDAHNSFFLVSVGEDITKIDNFYLSSVIHNLFKKSFSYNGFNKKVPNRNFAFFQDQLGNCKKISFQISKPKPNTFHWTQIKIEEFTLNEESWRLLQLLEA